MSRDHLLTTGNGGTEELTEFSVVTEDIGSMEGTCSPVQGWDLTAGLSSTHLTRLSFSDQEQQSRKYFSAQASTALGFPSSAIPRGLSLGFLRCQCKVVSEGTHRESGYVRFSPE